MPSGDFRASMPVTAYTIGIPVLINGTNVNTPQHPALNFRLEGGQYLIYIPATEFSRVGANLYWDNVLQQLIITAPNCKQTIAAMQSDINTLKAESNAQMINEANYGNSNRTTRVLNVTSNEIQFDAAPVTFIGNYLGFYTKGNSYPYYPSSASGGQRGIIVKDNFGVWHTFGYHIPLP